MTTESRTCQNCKSGFNIDLEDFAFYERAKVPLPKLCSPCRLQRRMSFRNERNFYKRSCGLCAKSIISMYATDVSFPVYCQSCWWSDKWQPPELDYDSSRNFLEQFRELRDKTPHESTQAPQSVDSEYANFVANTKGAYLSSVVLSSRDILHSRFLNKCADSVECDYASNLEKCVRVSYGADCYLSRDSRNVEGCQKTIFSAYSTNLSDCYGCINLKHKKYCILNQQYSKEEYFEKLEELEALPIEEQKEMTLDFWLKNPIRGTSVFSSANCSGTEIYYSKNLKECFLGNYVRDGAYLFEASSGNRSAETTHDIWDCSIVIDFQSSYEVIGGSRSSECKFGFLNDDCLKCQYSMFLYGCSDTFGCVGLRNKKYRILNKEYSKDEYEEVIRNIAQDMAIYGEFFPIELSPFAYNETIAQDYMPLSKEKALAAGFKWKNAEPHSYQVTMEADNLPAIQDVSDNILKEVIGCAHRNKCGHHCTTAFKIAPQELSILKQTKATLPALCPNCRRAEQVPIFSLALTERQCQCAGSGSENKAYSNLTKHSHEEKRCLSRFSSSYSPDRPEIVYCEQCYQAEVA